MPGGTQTIDRQLGAFEAKIEALCASHDRQAEATDAMRISLNKIELQLARIDGERKAAIWMGRLITALVGAVAGAMGGHLSVPPGTH